LPAKAIPSGWPNSHRRITAPLEALREALRGRVTRHRRFLLRLHLQQIDAINAAIGEIDQEVDARSSPFAPRSNC
jgi:transposase